MKTTLDSDPDAICPFCGSDDLYYVIPAVGKSHNVCEKCHKKWMDVVSVVDVIDLGFEEDREQYSDSINDKPLSQIDNYLELSKKVRGVI